MTNKVLFEEGTVDYDVVRCTLLSILSMKQLLGEDVRNINELILAYETIGIYWTDSNLITLFEWRESLHMALSMRRHRFASHGE